VIVIAQIGVPADSERLSQLPNLSSATAAGGAIAFDGKQSCGVAAEDFRNDRGAAVLWLSWWASPMRCCF